MDDHVRAPTGTRIAVESHARLGIGKPYPKETREQVNERHLLGLPVSNAEIHQLRQAGTYPCRSTCYNWRNQYAQVGHVLPKRRTGNRRATREIKGDDLVQLALFRLIKPKAYQAEVRAHLYNLNPGVNGAPYSNSQVTRAEQALGLTRKVGSTSANEAYKPVNLKKRELYWNRRYPLGIVDINVNDIIDIDECALFLETTNRKYGKVVRGRRCYQKGVYNRGQKMNCLAAVSADSNNPMRWVETWEGEGTTLERFYYFIEKVINDLEVTYPGRKFCFTMDNLNTHKNPMILTMIRQNHRVIFRAPYWAVDGAIEYIFNTLQTNLMLYFDEIETMDELENKAKLIMASIETFRPYFEHVGFAY